jgi:hypothetical protein
MVSVTPIVSATVCGRIRIVVTTITIWWPPIATSISENRSQTGTQDERA